LKLVTGNGFFRTFKAVRIPAVIQKFAAQTCKGPTGGGGTVKSLSGSFGKVNMSGFEGLPTGGSSRAAAAGAQLSFTRVGDVVGGVSNSHFITMSGVPSSALSIGTDTA